ncbi:MAG: DUF438 domain-containing protein [Erysipelotrichaceae bacterium]
MDKQRIQRLEEYIRRSKTESGFSLYQEFKEDINSITPMETMELMNRRLIEGEEVKDVLETLEKFVHVFSTALKNHIWTQPVHGTFLWTLLEENKALAKRLDTLRPTLLKRDYTGDKLVYLDFLGDLNAFNAHYLKKENMLFPALELKNDRFVGLKIMWALHDDIRRQLKTCIRSFAKTDLDPKEIETQIGILYFQLYGNIEKEERILFPIASEILSINELDALLEESFEYGFPYIDTPKKPKSHAKSMIPDGSFTTTTGSMSSEQLLSLFSALPVDVTFVDDQDKVRFFNKGKDRIFPRSPAIIGRDVRNCHPPQSVHVVLDIIESFKNKTQDSATFWIQMGPKFVLIQYFALRSEDGKYLGTLEVSQNVNEIRALEGERRILS